MKKPNKKTEPKPTNKPTLVAFLLDRSGSMESCKAETISGFNGYIDELVKQKNGGMRFTLTQFDTVSVDIIHDATTLEGVAKLNSESYSPRGGTPLYDAIGKTIRAAEATAGDKFKVLFVTLTDGLENSSSEWNSDSVKALMKEKEDKNHWTFAHIGVGENGWAQMAKVAAGTRSASNVLNIRPDQTKKTYARMGGMTRMYACSAKMGMSVSAQNMWKGHKPDDEAV